MDLIFDIMSSGNYLNNKAEIDKNHNVVCAGRGELIDLTDDDEITDFAVKNNLTSAYSKKFIKPMHGKNI